MNSEKSKLVGKLYIRVTLWYDRNTEKSVPSQGRSGRDEIVEYSSWGV